MNNSRNKNSTSGYLIAGLIATILVVGGIYLVNQQGADTKIEDNQDNTGNTSHQEKNERNGKDKKYENNQEEKSKHKIQFSEYQKFLQQAKREPADQIKGCSQEHGLLELIFLSRDDDSSIQPFQPEGGSGLTLMSNNDNCESYAWGAGSRRFRFLFRVYKNCTKTKSCSGVAAGETYRITQVSSFRRLNYEIQIPEASEFTFKKEFKSLTGKKDDPVKRIPLLLEDLLSTQPENLGKTTAEMWTSQKLTIKDVPKLEQKENSGIRFDYYYNDTVHDEFQQVKPGRWEITVRWMKKDEIENPMGGTLVVYEEKFHAEPPYMRLHGYIEHVQTNPVSLSGSNYVRVKKQDIQSHKIEITELLKKKIPDKFKSWSPERIMKEGIFLSLKKKNLRDKVYAFSGRVTYQDKSFYTTIKAPEGDYVLIYGKDYILDNDFHWPPK